MPPPLRTAMAIMSQVDARPWPIQTKTLNRASLTHSNIFVTTWFDNEKLNLKLKTRKAFVGLGQARLNFGKAVFHFIEYKISQEYFVAMF